MLFNTKRLEIEVRRGMLFMRFGRCSFYFERVPLLWSAFANVEQRVECAGKVRTWDAIVGDLRIIASVQ